MRFEGIILLLSLNYNSLGLHTSPKSIASIFVLKHPSFGISSVVATLRPLLMDPFKHFLSTEGYSSSESGWTRYLASPTRDDFECIEDNYDNNHNIKDDGEGNSDDSMASDASSAPTHHQYKHKDGQGSHGNAHGKHDKGDNTSKHSSRKDTKKEAKTIAENSGKSKTKLGSQAKYRK
ncbi:hypothetical protein DITRI_Ditri11bG0023800 [Diplodiscus trichospermus]